MRLFFALWPPRETAQALHRWAAEVCNESRGKLTPVENIHLTLAFLGNAEPAEAIAAARTVQGRRHQLPIDAARYVKRNEMVWIAPDTPPEALLDFVSQLHASLRAKGFVLETRPFAAHVTLIRRARQPRTIPPLPAVSWPAEEFLLVSSRTSAAGSAYVPVERFPLR